jgi:tRNA(adenine34) deaminase
MNRRERKRLVPIVLLVALCARPTGSIGQSARATPADVDRLEVELNGLTPEPKSPDDRFVLVCLREAIAASRDGSGGIGACLVREDTGEIVERGRNRQFSPHFRSDLHAEMDLLDRYEDRTRALRPTPGNPQNPRQMYEGLVLYTSFEPCPMCTTRILNTGIRRILYAAPDPDGGMTSRIDGLPPFWREQANGKTFAPARCSPRLTEVARILFGPYSLRGFKPQSPPADGRQ